MSSFSFFRNVFIQIIVSPFVHSFEIIFLFAAEVEEPKIGISGKGLIRSNAAFDREKKERML